MVSQYFELFQNTRLLGRSQNLPDKGQRLKEKNAQLRDRESELLAKVMHAKENMVRTDWEDLNTGEIRILD